MQGLQCRVQGLSTGDWDQALHCTAQGSACCAPRYTRAREKMSNFLFWQELAGFELKLNLISDEGLWVNNIWSGFNSGGFEVKQYFSQIYFMGCRVQVKFNFILMFEQVFGQIQGNILMKGYDVERIRSTSILLQFDLFLNLVIISI